MRYRNREWAKRASDLTTEIFVVVRDYCSLADWKVRPKVRGALFRRPGKFLVAFWNGNAGYPLLYGTRVTWNRHDSDWTRSSKAMIFPSCRHSYAQNIPLVELYSYEEG